MFIRYSVNKRRTSKTGTGMKENLDRPEGLRRVSPMCSWQMDNSVGYTQSHENSLPSCSILGPNLDLEKSCFQRRPMQDADFRISFSL